MKGLCYRCFSIYPSDHPVREESFWRWEWWEGTEGQATNLSPLVSTWRVKIEGSLSPGESGCLSWAPVCQSLSFACVSVMARSWALDTTSMPPLVTPPWVTGCPPSIDGTHLVFCDSSWVFCKPLQIPFWYKIKYDLHIFLHVFAYNLC